MNVRACVDKYWLLSEGAFLLYAPCMYQPRYENFKKQMEDTWSNCLKNVKYKDQGIGTKAERLAIKYVFDDLGIPVLYADSIQPNTRSQHVLEKVGFKFIKEDAEFKYYRIDREDNREAFIRKKENSLGL